ncbi:hypothetical protein PR048_008007 [Dryococelus australis]|uniref:Uncharacterized protein n=1 Tax=Dryococelus australis TaxID=614101 RepID=A0ABQ9HWP9_9NEOP|nr:hypothetical protein PR048_008007 [Dryococelus australis]
MCSYTLFQVTNNPNILQLAVSFITANLVQGDKVVHENTVVENVHQFVSETTSIIKHCVERNSFLYTDVHQGLVQDLIISSLYSSALPVSVFNKKPHYNPSLPREATAFMFLPDKGKVDLYMEYLAQISKLLMWNSQSQVIFIDINFSENPSDMYFELLKTSWQKYETDNSLVICMTEHSDKSGKFATAKIFNQFIAPGIIIKLTCHNNTCKESPIHFMGYPLRCTPTDFPPFFSR